MKTIQVVLDERTLAAADREVRRRRINRSALVREALQTHLRRLATRAAEARHRRGYERCPVERGEFDAWDAVGSWPED